MGTKISGATAATSATSTDQFEVNQGGATKRVTALQIKKYVASYFVAQCTTSADVTYSTGNTRINYDTKVGDPFTAVTTGGSWVFTAPETGGYMFIADEHDTDGNSFDWGAQATLKIYLWKVGSPDSYLGQLAYRTFDSAVAYADQSDVFLSGTSVPQQLTTGDQVYAQYRNSTSHSRKLYAGARLTIMRVY